MIITVSGEIFNDKMCNLEKIHGVYAKKQATRLGGLLLSYG